MFGPGGSFFVGWGTNGLPALCWMLVGVFVEFL